MEICLFVGIQASGKSTFFRTYFATTHVHVSKDTLRSSKTLNKTAKQLLLVEEALREGKSVVVDNTNPTKEDREPLIILGHRYGVNVIGYVFQSTVRDARQRNSTREGKARVPDAALYITAHKLVIPTYEEGFDGLWSVSIMGEGQFQVSEIPHVVS